MRAVKSDVVWGEHAPAYGLGSEVLAFGWQEGDASREGGVAAGVGVIYEAGEVPDYGVGIAFELKAGDSKCAGCVEGLGGLKVVVVLDLLETSIFAEQREFTSQSVWPP